MRIIVMSDSHGNKRVVKHIVESNMKTADIFVHLGDGEREMSEIIVEYPYVDFRCVAGNTDSLGIFPRQLVIDLDKARIYLSHGHNHYVKHSTVTIRSIAEDNDCNIALFGHTHERFSGYFDGLHILNPGSCSAPRDGLSPSYGYIDITANGIVTNIVSLDSSIYR